MYPPDLERIIMFGLVAMGYVYFAPFFSMCVQYYIEFLK